MSDDVDMAPAPAAGAGAGAPAAAAASSKDVKDKDDIDEKVEAAVEAEAAEVLKAMDAGDGGGDDDAVGEDGKPRKQKKQKTAGAAGGKKRGRGAPQVSAADAALAMDNMMSRLDALLKRTEQRASGTDGAAPAEAPAAASASGRRGKAAQGKSGRHRMAEKEEDEKLVADELKEENGRVVLTAPPTILKFPPGKGMRAYQLEGLNWLLNMYEKNLNGILADEMGLGKTLEAISLLAYLREYRKIPGPHLIIVPKSTISNWKREINRWCPDISAFIFHGAKDERPALREKLFEHNVCITTYEMAIIETSALKKLDWVYLFIDEAHRIKNENSILSKVVRLFDTKRRLLITGTPLQNNLRELWALLNFLMPDLFDSSEDFEAWFDMANGADQRNQLVGRLHKILKPFLLRRMKVDVEKSLPPKVETKLYVGLSQMQLKWYSDILSKNLDQLNAATGQKMRLLNIVMQIRKVCNHPYLFDGAEPGPPYYDGEHLIDNAGKMVLLDKLLRRLQERGSRVLIFSQMTRMLDILEDYCRLRGYQYNRIDGSTSQADRDNGMDEFNAKDSEKFIFLLSTRAGGLGINLQTADTVILYDSDWNPQMDLQAMDRAHRIGQTKPVNVYRFVSEKTMEEKIIEKATRKLFLDALVIKQGRLADQDVKLGSDELQAMLRFGATQIFQTKEATITDEDIEAILKKGEERTAADNEKIKALTQDVKTFDFDKAFAGPFVDRDAPVGKQPEQISDGKAPIEFVELAKRERKKAFNEAEYYRNALKTSNQKRAKEFKENRRPDFQFFNNERLIELERKDYEAKHKMKILRDAERAREKEESKKRAIELKAKKASELKAKKRETKAAAAAAKKEAAATGADGAAAAATTASGSPVKPEQQTLQLPNPSPSPSPSPSPTKELAAAAAAAPVASDKNEKELAVKAEKEPAATAAAAAAAADDADGDDAGSDAEMDDAEGGAVGGAPGKGRRKSGRVAEAAKTEEEKHAAEERKKAMEEEAGCLTADEEEEKARLERDGFGEWKRPHFVSFIRACEQFGRKKIDAISKAVEGKTPEEVKRYYHVFWKKYTEMPDHEKYIKQIEKGEARLQKVLDLQKTLDKKVAGLKKPLEQMDIPYTGAAQKTFTPEEDRFIITTVAAEGYGNWATVQLAIRASPQFRFDWFMRSRSVADLQRRCDYLIKLLKNSEGGDEPKRGRKKADADAEKEKPKRSRSKAAAAAAADADDADGDAKDAKPKKGKKKPAAAAAAAAAAMEDDDEDDAKPLGQKAAAAAAAGAGKKGKGKGKGKAAAAAAEDEEEDAPAPKANGKKRKAKAEPADEEDE